MKRIKAGVYHYKGYEIFKHGYYQPDQKTVWEAKYIGGIDSEFHAYTKKHLKQLIDNDLNKKMKGQIKIRHGVDNQEPRIVYVSGKNRNGSWICEILGTSETCFTSDKHLIDFDYDKFKIMHYEWQIENHDRIKERLIDLLKEYKDENHV